MRLGLFPESETAPASGAASSDSPRNHPRFHRQQTLALQLLAGELAGATDGFCPLPDSSLGRLFIVAAELHLAEETLALHLLLQRLEGLVDIVVTDENLHVVFLLIREPRTWIWTVPVPMATVVRIPRRDSLARYSGAGSSQTITISPSRAA